MTDPAITAAIDNLVGNAPPPVTVWGVRYTQQIGAVLAGHIFWLDTEPEARAWLDGMHSNGHPGELVTVTSRLHPADGADGGDR